MATRRTISPALCKSWTCLSSRAPLHTRPLYGSPSVLQVSYHSAPYQHRQHYKIQSIASPFRKYIAHRPIRQLRLPTQQRHVAVQRVPSVAADAIDALDAPTTALDFDGRIICGYMDQSGHFSPEHKLMTKAEIAEQFELRQRDLRDLDIRSESVARVLVRPRTILIQFFHICMIVQADEALLVTKVSGSPSSSSSSSQSPPSSTTPNNNVEDARSHIQQEFERRMANPAIDPPGLPQLPYELRAVEATLDAVLQRLRSDLLTARSEAEAAASHLILTSDRATLGLDAVYECTRRIASIEQRARMVCDTLRELLDTDEDLAGLYLTDARNGNPHATADHQEAEYMLEAYRTAADALVDSARAVTDGLRKKENTFRSALAVQRNRIMFLEARVAIHTLGLASGTMVAGLFGMNLVNHFEESPYGFAVMTGGCVVLSALFSWYGMRSLRRIRSLKDIVRTDRP